MQDKKPLPLTVGQIKKILPDIENALLRRQFQPLVDKLGLDFFRNSHIFFFPKVVQACTPPRDQTEERLMLLADLAAGLLFREIPQTIKNFLFKALPEVEQAYDAAKNAEGGWSSMGRPEKRKEAVLQWYKINRDRLQILEERHLKGRHLYKDGSGQDKRDFQNRLLQNIIGTKYQCEIPDKDISTYLKAIRGAANPLRDYLK